MTTRKPTNITNHLIVLGGTATDHAAQGTDSRSTARVFDPTPKELRLEYITGQH